MANQIVKDYLKRIDEVIENGKYKDNWESLSNVPVPSWYQNAKFGIFIHWGVYSVPAFESEWYPRLMYIEGTDIHKHHVETYGEPKDFGYEDFIPMFKAEEFDASEWINLFKDAGAKYIMPVAEHHDGFQMYDSAISNWNASKMGPKRDVIGELKIEAEKEGLVFTASSHRAENYWFFGGCRNFDSGLQEMEYQEPYGYAQPLYLPTPKDSHNINCGEASQAHLEDWLVRTCELVDKYQPKVVWFDWWIHNKSFKPYLKKFAAYYYNRALEWGEQVAINYKYDAYFLDTAIFDVERGQLSDIRPRLWQTDTAVARNSWGYTENNDFKSPESLVCDLIDIVSKNGCLLLNVGPKSDGTITQEDRDILLAIGKWLSINGESIYDTTYWKVYGEGDTKIEEGAFTDKEERTYASNDIRFTVKAPYLYANVLAYDSSKTLTITSLRNTENNFNGVVESIEVLGYDNAVDFVHDADGLHINVDGTIETTYPVCFKIALS